MRITSRLICLLTPILLVASCGCSKGTTRQSSKSDESATFSALQTGHQALTIAIPVSIDLTDAAADTALSTASAIVQGNTLPSGSKCNLFLERSGHIQQSINGITNVDSVVSAQKLCTEPNGASAYLHEVPVISYCGGIQVVQGCSEIGLPCMIVSGYDVPNQTVEGILWAHEFGHTKGLTHRGDTNALMNPVAAAGHLSVNVQECASLVSAPMLQTAPKILRFQAQSGNISLRDFVHESTSSGEFDILTAKKYGSQSVSQLISLLNSPAEKPYATTIVKLLGILGDDKTVGSLVTYVHKGSGEITPSDYRSKIAAILSIGYIANAHYVHNPIDEDGGPALIFLSKLASTNAADSLLGTWHLKGQELKNRDSDAIRTAVLGLGVSGSPQAAKVLDALTERTESFGLAPQGVEIRDVLDIAKKDNLMVNEQGLEKYYRSSRQ